MPIPWKSKSGIVTIVGMVMFSGAWFMFLGMVTRMVPWNLATDLELGAAGFIVMCVGGSFMTASMTAGLVKKTQERKQLEEMLETLRALRDPSPSPNTVGKSVCGTPAKPIRVATYSGGAPEESARKFEAEAQAMAREGYTPTSQAWQGSALTVVYQLSAGDSAARPTETAPRYEFQTWTLDWTSRPSVFHEDKHGRWDTSGKDDRLMAEIRHLTEGGWEFYPDYVNAVHWDEVDSRGGLFTQMLTLGDFQETRVKGATIQMRRRKS